MFSGAFNSAEWLRYSRHIQLSEVGGQGQLKLKQAHVLIIGVGGLGCPVAQYLAAAGVGQISLLDGDRVELSNLQRQILFGQDQVGDYKADAAKQRLQSLNAEINVSSYCHMLDAGNAHQYISQADIVIDCTDNFSSRYLINDSCLELNKPWVFSSIHHFKGQCSLFLPGPGQACFRCLFPLAPGNQQDCNSGGVLGVLPGFMAMVQALETLKWILSLGIENNLSNSLLVFDSLKMNFKTVALQPDPECRCCGISIKQPDRVLIEDTAVNCKFGSNPLELSPKDFWHAHNNDEVIVMDVRSEDERQLFSLAGNMVTWLDFEKHRLEIDTEKRIICYCQSGSRSLQAATQLRQQGFKQASSLKGGLGQYLKFLSEQLLL